MTRDGEGDFMNTGRPGATDSFPDGVFVMLTCAIGGALLLHAWLAMVHATLPLRIVATLPWLSLMLLAVLRMRRAASASATRPGPGAVASTVGGALVLLAAGNIVGVFVVAGSTLPLAAVAAAGCFAPWGRVRLCRHRPVRASLLVCAAGALVPGACHDAVQAMFLPVAAWVLGMCGLAGFARLSLQRRAPAGALPLLD